MKSTPRDARLTVVAIVLIVLATVLPRPTPSAHVELHQIKQADPVAANMAANVTVEAPADSTATASMEWKMWRPFPNKKEQR